MKQQTAVEWLEQSIMNNVTAPIYERLKREGYFEQANQMFERQIMKAVYDGMGTNFDPNMGRAELYYKETYKTQNK